MKRHQRQNEKGIAIIIVIAIMVALMMIVTALLGTVTRMGDTAKSYKYDSLLRLGCLSARANAIKHIGNKKSSTDAIEDVNYTPCDGDLVQYYDKDFNFIDNTTIDDDNKQPNDVITNNAFFKLELSYHILDLGSCLNLAAINKADASQKKVYTEMKENINFIVQACTDEELKKFKVLGNEKTTIDAMIPEEYDPAHPENDPYGLKRVGDAMSTAGTHLLDARCYTFNDIGQQLSKKEIYKKSLLFSPYGGDAIVYSFKRIPNWLLASMIANYRYNEYRVGGDGETVSLSATELAKVYGAIIKHRGSADSAKEVYNSLFGDEVGIYTKNEKFVDPPSNQQKKNAALEKLAFSLFGLTGDDEDTCKYLTYLVSEAAKAEIKAGRIIYDGVNFTGRLGSSNFCRVLVKAELKNLATDESIGRRDYELVYDESNSTIIYSHWFDKSE